MKTFLLGSRRIISSSLLLSLLLAMPFSTTAHAGCYIGDPDTPCDDESAIAEANQAGLTAPYAPTTPGDIRTLINFAQIQQQNEQNTLALLGPALQQADQAASFGLGVLNAGGDPNLFFGQQSAPSTLNTSLQDPLYAGPGSDTSVLINTINNLLNPGTPFRTFAPPWLDSVSRDLYLPTNPAPNISFEPTPIPGSCSLPNPSLPETTITFIHNGSHPVGIYYLDLLCQKILYRIIYPGQIYNQLTYVGQTWFFVDLTTNMPLFGEPEFVVPNSNPQFYTISVGPGQQQSAQVKSITAMSASDIITARYTALGQLQLSHYYNDTNLSGLRIESNRQFLSYLYTDPLYLYWISELDSLNNHIRTSQPSYSSLQSLSQEINSWTTPPTDEQTVREHYAKRLQLQAAQSQLEDEVAAYDAANPSIVNQMNALRQSITQRVQQIQQRADYILWSADWTHRMQIAYYLSSQGLAETQEIKQLQKDYPDFAEYQQIRREVTNLLPAFNDFPQVKRVADVRQAILADQAANQLTKQYSDQYIAQTTAVLSITIVPVNLENYYEQLNGLLNTNTTYNQLKANQFLSVKGLDAYRQQVHDAVAQCYKLNNVIVH